jgi:uncharacterized protein
MKFLLVKLKPITVIKKALIIFVIAIISASSVSQAQQIPPRPSPPRLMNDLAGVLPANQQQQLEEKLVTFNNETSNQITVVIVPSFNGLDRADFAIRIGHEWGVGQKGFDNGVVVLVKPRRGNERGEAFIAVGYGLEPVITDAASRRIIENEMIPYFSEGNYYAGIDAATKVLMGLAKQEFSSDEYAPQVSPLTGLIPLIIIILFLVIFSRKSSSQKTMGKDIPFWSLLFLLSSMNSGRGSYGNFSGGRGSFGGGFKGGSSFGGFGGGRFGGGGAGGSW